MKDAVRSMRTVAPLSIAYFGTFVAMATTHAVVLRAFPWTTRHLLFDLPLVLAGSTAGILLWLALRHVAARSFPRQVAAAVLLIAILSLLLQACVSLILAPALAPGYPAKPDLTFVKLATESLIWFLPLGLWSAMLLARIHDVAARERERRLAEARAEAQDAQLRALRYQINPHFLYNTLNSIASLVLDGRNETAETMIVRLSDFLRATLESDPTADVTLAEEIALQKLYLDIERLRFSEHLHVRIDVPADLGTAKVPALILQPLVENALKYGVSHRGETRVSLTARRAGDVLVIDVTDEGPGHVAGSGTGIGLANVRRRLRTRFGETAQVQTRSLPEGFRVTVSLPLVTA